MKKNRKNQKTQAEIINEKVTKGVFLLYALAVIAYFVQELMRARKAEQ